MQAVWMPTSWQNNIYRQRTEYPSKRDLLRVTNKLLQLAPLVDSQEINTLRQKLAEVFEGPGFLLQTGDCAESFAEDKTELLVAKFQAMTTLAEFCSQTLGSDVVTIGRIAGQFAKPRTVNSEQQQHYAIPSYRGDLINGADTSILSRQPNPARMLAGYDYAQKVLNTMRLHHTPFIYTSHEALHLAYEQALLREQEGRWYCLSAHFPWVGLRNNFKDSAHIEFARGIENPIALKIGLETDIAELLATIALLNPKQIPGKITFITRIGGQASATDTNRISTFLNTLITAIKKSAHPVLWMCDPMHGNTKLTQQGKKTRFIADIINEIKITKQCLAAHQLRLHGIHLETSAFDIHECLMDNEECTEPQQYQSLVDPRLNQAQAMHVIQEACVA